jgi:pimeloyl-ACP methyl ester carboxylesterase
MIWHERGGTGPRTILLLHGLGATGAVWSGVRRIIESRSNAQYVVVDLSGHGGSRWRTTYSVGELAADLVPFIPVDAHTIVAGHSLGAYLGLALASGWFGVRIAGVLGIGPKISWTEKDLQTMRELAARPVRTFDEPAEAVSRYRRMSGLTEEVTSGDEPLARGTTRTEEGFRLSQDPRSFLVAGAPFSSLIGSATCPVVLARGEGDQMVSTDELRAHCKDAVVIPGAGHNAHVEKPDAVVDLIERLYAQTPR